MIKPTYIDKNELGKKLLLYKDKFKNKPNKIIQKTDAPDINEIEELLELAYDKKDITCECLKLNQNLFMKNGKYSANYGMLIYHIDLCLEHVDYFDTNVNIRQ